MSTYVAKAGRTAELRTLLFKAAGYLSGIGEGQAHVRVTWLGGEAAGRYTLFTLNPSVSAQMSGFDRIIADVANNPLGAFAGADAPGTILSRFTIETLTGDAPVTDVPAIITNLAFQIVPGKRAEALGAFAAAEQRHQGLGVQARAWQVSNLGPVSGPVVYVTPTSSYAELAEFRAKDAALGQPGPIAAAVEAGVLIPGGQSSTLLSSPA